MVRVLVCGDAEGKLGTLFSKISTLNGKQPVPFDLCLCVGRFATSPTELSPYVSGTSKVPIPTYFLGGDERDAYFVNDLEPGAKMCDNLFYLGKAGLSNIAGVNVAFLSGRYDSGTYCGIKGPREDSFTGMYREEDVLAVEKACKGKVVDILVTNEWPRGTYGGMQMARHPPAFAESPGVADLVGNISPRYHFAGRGGIFFERAPHKNKTAEHVCRFLAMAKVGNDQKQKWVYAVNITPGSGLDSATLNQTPPDTTPCPFGSTAEPPAKRQRGNDGLLPAPQQGSGRLGRSNQRQQPQEPANCWFCIASPDVATHLIVSIGTEAYVALPKGGVDDDHCLILPITHYRSTPRCPAEVRKEIDMYKDALRKYLSSKNLDMMVFERNSVTRPGGDHMHIQVIPVPKEHSAGAAEVFHSEGEKFKMFFRELDNETSVEDAAGDEPFFFVECPSGERLIHVISKDERHPMQFGIQTSCAVIQRPDKADWKKNALSQDGEVVLADRFKEAFSKFDPFLQ